MGDIRPSEFFGWPGCDSGVLEPAPIDVLRLSKRAAGPDDLRHGVGQRAEIAFAFLERGVLLSDFLEHVVEGRPEDSDLVAASNRGADGVVAIGGDYFCGRGQPQDRSRNFSLKRPGNY